LEQRLGRRRGPRRATGECGGEQEREERERNGREESAERLRHEGSGLGKVEGGVASERPKSIGSAQRGCKRAGRRQRPIACQTPAAPGCEQARRLRPPERLGSLRRRPARRQNLAEWFFTSDLHGSGELYEQVMSLAAARRPRAVILGGDLAPHGTGAAGVGHQRVFLEGFLVEFARRLREAAPGAELLLMMGNDD